jgi:hypothetical protein
MKKYTQSQLEIVWRGIPAGRFKTKRLRKKVNSHADRYFGMFKKLTLTDLFKFYYPAELLVEEFMRKDWLFKSIEKDPSYRGYEYIVPFNFSQSSEMK